MEGEGQLRKGALAYLTGDGESPIATMSQCRLSELSVLNVIFGPATEGISINLGVCLQEL